VIIIIIIISHSSSSSSMKNNFMSDAQKKQFTVDYFRVVLETKQLRWEHVKYTADLQSFEDSIVC
jgi:hypothetical protein